MDEVVGNDVVIHFQLPDATGKSLVCVDLSRETGEEQLLKEACVEVTPVTGSEMNLIKLSKVPQGRSRVELYEDGRRDAAATVTLELQHMQEIIPTYDWEPLKVWHTIPSGLETRLPLDGKATKECRIPSPWRLQLFYPPPCRHFFRMDLYRSTSVKEIVRRAASTCHIADSCVSLSTEEGAILALTETVESSELFTNSPILQIDESCSVDGGVQA